MKELNIIEVSKMPNGEFEVYYPNGTERIEHIKTDENGNLINCDYTTFNKAYYHDIIQAKFIPISKSVSLMEAIKTYKEGKSLTCIVNGEKFYYPNKYKEKQPFLAIEDNNGNGIGAKEILEGKWYIED